MILMRRIETYPPERRAQFALASDEIDADKFGDYARKLTAMSPEAFHVTYAAASAAAQQTIANGVDPDFALIDFFVATLAVSDGKGWSGVDSYVHRALEEGDQELAAVAIRKMPQCFKEQLGETFGITTDNFGEYADQVDAMPSEDFELMHRAACPMAQRSGASPGEQFTRAYAGQLVMMFRRGIRPCDAKAYEENDRLHTEANAAEKAGNDAAAAKLRAAAKAKRDATLEAQAAAKRAEMRAAAKAKAEADRRDKEQRLLAVRLQAEARATKVEEELAALRRERDEAKQALTLVQAKAADQAAAELLAAEEAAEASAAVAKKKKKKRRGKRGGGAAPMAAVDAPPAEPPAADAVAAMFEAAAPSPADEPTIDEPQQHDEFICALLRRLGLAERVGPVFAREQIDENALPFLTVEDLVEAGVAAADARKIVSTVEFEARRAAGTALVAVPDAEPAAEPADTAAEEPAAAAEDTPAPESKQIPERLCCPISLELMERPVIAADGHTYDRSSIEDWLARGNTTSPTTGAPLEHLHLADNHLVRSMVSEYQDSLASR